MCVMRRLATSPHCASPENLTRLVIPKSSWLLSKVENDGCSLWRYCFGEILTRRGYYVLRSRQRFRTGPGKSPSRYKLLSITGW